MRGDGSLVCKSKSHLQTQLQKTIILSRPDSDDSPLDGQGSVVSARQADNLANVENLTQRILLWMVEGRLGAVA